MNVGEKLKPETKERVQQILNGNVPEGYKKTKVGIVPNEWDAKQLKHILEQVARKVSKPQEGYWRLGLRSHAKGTFHEFVDDPDSIAMEELFSVAENDLIVNITFAWEHAIALANRDDEGKLVSHRFPTYLFNGKVCPYFYKYYVIQPQFKKMLSDISPGGAGRNRVMSKSSFQKLFVVLPPLPEQEKIADIILTWDKSIVLKERLIAEKREQKNWLMQNLLTGEKRIPNCNGEWQEVRMGDVFIFEKGLSASRNDLHIDEGICYLHYGDIHKSNKSYINVKNEHTLLPKLMIPFNELNKNYLLYDGDIVFVDASEDYEGTCKYVVVKNKENIPFIAGLHTIIARAKNDLISNDFKQHCFSTFDVKKQFAIYSNGVSIYGINKSSIVKVSFLLPPLLEQTAIAEILSAADREIDLHEKQLEELKKQKKALMQLLLTGIVRVNKQGVSG